MNQLSHFISVPLRYRTIIPIAVFGMSLSFLSNLAFAEAADKNKPIDLEADSVKVDDAKQLSIYTGNVILTQGTLIIRAEKLLVQEDSQGFQHSTSLGTPNKPTTFKQKREGKNEYMEGSAQRIEYNGRMDKVQLYTKAWVKRGEDIVHGDYIMYDANAEYAEVFGGNPEATNSNAPKGRVRAVIQPKNKEATPSPSPNSSFPVSPTPNKAVPNNSTPNTATPKPSSSQAPAIAPAETSPDPRLSRSLQIATDGQ